MSMSDGLFAMFSRFSFTEGLLMIMIVMLACFSAYLIVRLSEERQHNKALLSHLEHDIRIVSRGSVGVGKRLLSLEKRCVNIFDEFGQELQDPFRSNANSENNFDLKQKKTGFRVEPAPSSFSAKSDDLDVEDYISTAEEALVARLSEKVKAENLSSRLSR